MKDNCRNFWIEAQAFGHGKKTFGPTTDDGGIEVSIFQRDQMQSRHAVKIAGTCDKDGKLTLRVVIAGQPDTVIESRR